MKKSMKVIMMSRFAAYLHCITKYNFLSFEGIWKTPWTSYEININERKLWLVKALGEMSPKRTDLRREDFISIIKKIIGKGKSYVC